MRSFAKSIAYPSPTPFVSSITMVSFPEAISSKNPEGIIAETVYAVGRTASEAKALGCKLKPYDPRFPKVSFWKVIDNKDAAKILQEKLNEIDGKGMGETIL